MSTLAKNSTNLVNYAPVILTEVDFRSAFARRDVANKLKKKITIKYL